MLQLYVLNSSKIAEQTHMRLFKKQTANYFSFLPSSGGDNP